MESKQIVCVIDDDDAIRRFARQTLERDGFEVRTYSTAGNFFNEFDSSEVDCVVTDLQMPQTTGEQVLNRLKEEAGAVSVVVVTGHADVATAVRLMQSGAFTLMEKPYKPADLLIAVHRAAERTRVQRAVGNALQRARSGLAQLTEEERSVMHCMIKGLPNKAIAVQLDLSMRTVDRRRNSVLSKMGVGSVSELASVVVKLEQDA